MIPLPKLVVIVPCYNEEEVLPASSQILGQLVDRLIRDGNVDPVSYVCFVDDGSNDRTWAIIRELHENKPERFKGLSLSRNFGHQAALLAALHEIDADIYISIDADLQDDEQSMIDMVLEYQHGADIVYGVRKERSSDTFVKRFMAQSFYKIMGFLGTHSIYNHADFRLMSSRAVRELRKYSESNIYLRGIVTELGFPTSKVYYDRKPRSMGESKYPFRKSLQLAWNGISSFSNTPLKLSFLLGLATCIFSLLILVYGLYSWARGSAVQGWTSLVFIVTLFSGLQMLFLGIIGEYIGKIFMESKRRPKYAIKDDLSK